MLSAAESAIAEIRRRSRDTDTSVVATVSRWVRDEDGEPVSLSAGMSWVARDHYLVDTYPECFGLPARKRPRPKRAGSGNHGYHGNRRGPTLSPTASPAWEPRVVLSRDMSPLTVRVLRGAWETVTSHAYMERGERETHGALFGPPAMSYEREALITFAGDPGPRTDGSKASVAPDMD